MKFNKKFEKHKTKVKLHSSYKYNNQKEGSEN